jgi:8-oxo-dGTP pyrophosphatase MutT (NUDIX family)
MHVNQATEDSWELPGGRMEFGETAEETLIREMKEETGLQVIPIKVLDTWNVVKEEHQITGIIYSCEIANENINIMLSSEHDQYQWVKAESSSLALMHKAFKERMPHWNWDEFK